MDILIVVNNPNDWPLDTPGVELVSARAYLSDPQYSDLRGAKVFNLCRSYRYQSFGYYVSLLAAARGHKPLPSITTIQDLKLQTMIRLAGDDLDSLIQKSFSHIQSPTFDLSIYFGRNIAERYDRLALALFNLFPAPLLRAKFTHDEGRWELRSINPIPASEIPTEHWLFMLYAANQYFLTRRAPKKVPESPRLDLAILYNPDEESAPSSKGAIDRFVKAAKAVGFDPEIIGKDDFGRLAEFEALFIRETTAVNHHTYRFARRAAAEGLAVIDDPLSIVRCTNKVYLAELLDRHGVPSPRTMIVHRDNIDQVPLWVGYPCVLKTPDGAFSRGVVKVSTADELDRALQAMLAKSDLVIAQAYLPSEFDWRVGVLNRKPLFVSKYHMARGHWQIVQTDSAGKKDFGKVETMAVSEAPKRVVNLAVKAANLIGDGLYGVDLKQVKGKCYVMEVNDNPNIDSGYEDRYLKGDLYLAVMQVLFDRAMAGRRGPGSPQPAAR
ncbi:MAG: RimK family protein [Phycisphaeraceae bacterium]|nr:RimK family protein [Phycisphaeraceae bacterium]